MPRFQRWQLILGALGILVTLATALIVRPSDILHMRQEATQQAITYAAQTSEAAKTATVGVELSTSQAQEKSTAVAQTATAGARQKVEATTTASRAVAIVESGVRMEAYYFCTNSLNLLKIGVPAANGINTWSSISTPYFNEKVQTPATFYLFIALVNTGREEVMLTELLNSVWQPEQLSPARWDHSPSITAVRTIGVDGALALLVDDLTLSEVEQEVRGVFIQFPEIEEIIPCGPLENWNFDRVEIAVAYNAVNLPDEVEKELVVTLESAQTAGSIGELIFEPGTGTLENGDFGTFQTTEPPLLPIP